MTEFHPEPDWLAEYAAGSLADSHALCVAAHLEHCSTCTSEVGKMASVGAALFSELTVDQGLLEQPAGMDPTAGTRSADDQNSMAATCTDNRKTDDTAIQQALARIEETSAQKPALDTDAARRPADHERLPLAFRKLAPDGLDKLNWKSIGKNLSLAEIKNLDSKRDVALHQLRPGASVAHHDHGGREVTVVLSGSFSDIHGQYNPGDFLVREPGEQHRPTASENMPCVCLSVTDAPVRFTGKLARLLNPLIAFRHP